MALQFILALLAGTIVGIFTGLFPGIHINLVAAIILASLPTLPFQPLTLVIFIASLAITHTLLDFIPTIFLGAPDEDSFLSILPGHKLLQKGRAQEAVVLSFYGSLSALPIILILTPIFILFLPQFFNSIKTLIPYILIFVSLYMVFREENFLLSLIIFSLAGFLGWATFNLPVKEPLMPLLTGLFGLSTLIISLKNKAIIPKQKTKPLKQIRLSKKETLKAIFSASIAAPLCSFLPGIGSGHAAVIGSELIKQSNKSFLFLIGAINTIVMSLSFVTAYSIGKTRTGASAAIKEILQVITSKNLTIIIITIIFSAIIAFVIGVHLAKIFSNILNRVNYKTLTLITILILLAINLIFSNPVGLLVLITSASLGIFTSLSNSRKINLMGSLIIPSILYYLIN